MSVKNYSFSEEERLKSKNEISRVFKDGIFLFEKHLSVVYLQSGIENSILHKMGVSVPKKYFKRAVDRNLLKRRIRESYRLNKAVLYVSQIPGLNMMFVYKSYTISDYAILSEEMTSLLNKIIQGNLKKPVISTIDI
jgi:ribonuclease P protein component